MNNNLTKEERDLVRRRDWRGMIHYGVIFFMLEKLGAVIGVSNLHIYAAMRGETPLNVRASAESVPLYLAAHGPKMLGVAAQHADGVNI